MTRYSKHHDEYPYLKQYSMIRTLQRISLLYTTAQRRNPILIQSATSGIVASVGDLSMQTFEGRGLGNYDLARTARMGLFRLAIFGPGYSIWIKQLDKFVKMSTPSRTVATKIMCDQFIWAPPALGVFYTWTCVTEGKTLQEGFQRVKSTLYPTLLVNWPVWCTVQMVTFSIIPTHFRVAWVSFIQVFWSAYLSGMNEQARNQEDHISNHRSIG